MDELFNLQIKDLHSSSSTVRIASFKKLYDLTMRVDKQFLKQKTFSVLYLRLKKITTPTLHPPTEPTKEVQSLLDVLFKPNYYNGFVFDNIDVNLQDAHLQGANLEDANLRSVNLQGANLQDANLEDAEMNNTILKNAELQGTNMSGARINKKTLDTMPNGWQESVIKHGNGKIGVRFVDNNDEVIDDI